MKKKKARTIILTASLAAVIGVGSAAAYFTDMKSVTNTFTVGSIETELSEPSWDEWNDPDDPDSPDEEREITPNQEIPKDPTMKNVGDNDAFVFMTVEVPVGYNVITAAENGSRINAADTQLFSYSVNPDWSLVTVNSGSVNTAALRSAENTSAPLKNLTGAQAVDYDAPATGAFGSVTYLYAYTGGGSSLKKLAKNESSTLFPAVQFVNAIEDQGLEKKTPSIKVTGYAIQSNFLNDGDTAKDGTNNGSPKVKPADVWDILKTQNSVVFD